MCVYFFFFKQKTAYDMRISDWSSDVCSSDLLLLLSPMLHVSSLYLGAALLIGAGAYQLTPLKHACLRHCRSPIEFIARYWRQGAGGAFRMGLQHGLFCLGCCWVLMMLLF